MNITALLSIILTLFLLLICGFFCRKIGIINDVSSKSLSKLILQVGQPMLIVSALCKAEYNEENLRIAWQVTLIGFAMHTLFALLAYFLCRPIKNPDLRKIFEFSLVFGNAGFIGFPILDSIYGGNIGSFMGAFYVISFHLFLWTWGMLILARGRDDIRLTPKKIFLNFGTVPCAIGVALFLLKPVFELPAFLMTFMTYLANLCTPISVLVTGAMIATMPLGTFFRNKLIYLQSALKLVAFPILFCLLAKVVGLSDTYILLVTAMAGVPTAASASMCADLYDIEPGFASQSVGMSSVLTTLAFPLAILFAQWVITW